MERITTAIIGGGASGLILAASLQNHGKTVLFERGERVGRKLSATGNGQGNITNLAVTQGGYFSENTFSRQRAQTLVCERDNASLTEFFNQLGVLLIANERGRVYPSGRQASALTDALRFFVSQKGVELRVNSLVTGIEKDTDGFVIRYKKADDKSNFYCHAQTVVLCAGGMAAKNFGTDGSGYALAQSFGHTLTPLYPSLVQLKTETNYTKSLKGIRVIDGVLTATTPTQKQVLAGDIIFTDYGVSGDAVFRMSAFIAAEIPTGKVELAIDFAPETDEKTILSILKQKAEIYPNMDKTELLFGIVNNQIGRAIMRRANGDLKAAASLVKRFTLPVTGSLGFDYAQVTKGGIPLSETDENLQSRLVSGLYFAGEILDVDGACGGFNLQWAYSSARKVAAAIDAQNTAKKEK